MTHTQGPKTVLGFGSFGISLFLLLDMISLTMNGLKWGSGSFVGWVGEREGGGWGSSALVCSFMGNKFFQCF